jgi:hypothetical protein
MYNAAIGSQGQAELVAQLVAGLARMDPKGSGRMLRRLILNRCELAFDLTPPPGLLKVQTVPQCDPLAASSFPSTFDSRDVVEL